MPDRAHVGLVDAHAERVRRDDDVDGTGHERVLALRARVGSHPRVVARDAQAASGQQVGGLLGRLAGAAVDDGRPVLLHGHTGDERGPLARDRALAVEAQDVEGEVGPVEAGAHPLGFAQGQAGDDLLGDLRRRGRRASHHRRVAELGDHRRQAQVVRAEIVAPLADAVGLVDDEQRERPVPQRGPERPAREALRRGEDDLGAAVADLAERIAVGRAVAARGEHHRRMAEVGEPRALVAHERDERRDDDGQVVPRKCGQLVAEALAAARRHDDERVAPVERRLHRLALPGPERTQPEQAQELLGRDVRRRGARLRRRDGRRWCGGGHREEVVAGGVVLTARPRRQGARAGFVAAVQAGQGGQVAVLVVVGRRDGRGRRGLHARGREPGQRRQCLALLRGEHRPAGAQLVERGAGPGSTGIGEDGGQQGEGALHCRHRSPGGGSHAISRRTDSRNLRRREPRGTARRRAAARRPPRLSVAEAAGGVPESRRAT